MEVKFTANVPGKSTHQSGNMEWMGDTTYNTTRILDSGLLNVHKQLEHDICQIREVLLNGVS